MSARIGRYFFLGQILQIPAVHSPNLQVQIDSGIAAGLVPNASDLAVVPPDLVKKYGKVREEIAGAQKETEKGERSKVCAGQLIYNSPRRQRLFYILDKALCILIGLGQRLID